MQIILSHITREINKVQITCFCLYQWRLYYNMHCDNPSRKLAKRWLTLGNSFVVFQNFSTTYQPHIISHLWYNLLIYVKDINQISKSFTTNEKEESNKQIRKHKIMVVKTLWLAYPKKLKRRRESNQNYVVRNLE